MPGADERPYQRGDKLPYVKPKLERLGTVQELTRGLGMNNLNDGEHPPGQNKSRF